MGNICGGPDSKQSGGDGGSGNYFNVNTIFKKRDLQGEMFDLEVKEHANQQQTYERDPEDFVLSKDNLEYKENQLWDVLEKKFDN